MSAQAEACNLNPPQTMATTSLPAPSSETRWPQPTAEQLHSQVECPRCTGRGTMQEFSHVAEGRCFLCGGARTVTLGSLIGWKTRGHRALSLVVWKPHPGRTARIPVGFPGAGFKETLEPRTETVIDLVCNGPRGTEWRKEWILEEQTPEGAAALRALFVSLRAQGCTVMVHDMDSFWWEGLKHTTIWNPDEWQREQSRGATLR